MPNWTENTLTFIVPAEKKDAFLETIQGPSDWPFPMEAFHEFERPKLDISNHLRIQIEKMGLENVEAISEFKAFMKPYGWPEWMKPSQTDIEVFLVDKEKLKGTIVPFSVAAISPWEDQKEFNDLFPDGTPHSTFWSPAASLSGSSTPIINLRHRKIGPKWPPSNIELDMQEDGDKVSIIVTFSTPWSPMDSVADLLDQVCRDHDAKFLLTWVEEQGLCGYTYHNPAGGEEPENVDYGFEHSWNLEVQDEDDPEDTWTEFDHVGFQDSVVELIDDADFS